MLERDKLASVKFYCAYIHPDNQQLDSNSSLTLSATGTVLSHCECGQWCYRCGHHIAAPTEYSETDE